MGLDIYTYRSKNFDKFMEINKLEKEIEQVGEDVWENDETTKDLQYEEISEADRERLSKASHEAKSKAAKEAGVEYVKDEKYSWYEVKNPYSETVEETSKVHPEHELYKVGYFRSSYNEGGINHVLQDRVGSSLYDIFDYSDEDDEYYFKPNWTTVKEKALKAKEDLKAAYARIGNVNVMSLSNYNSAKEDAPASSGEALAMYQEELDKRNANKDKGNGFDAYSNRAGLFNFADEPYKVRAIIQGKGDRFGFSDSTTYVIFESEGENTFYLDALDIIVETADLALSDPDNTYFLSWSA